ncbi:MAG: hypothetical protein Q9200_001848, partial [Gallowayella weberi]
PQPSAIGINCTPLQNLETILHTYESTLASLHLPENKKPWLILSPNGTATSTYNPTTHQWEEEENLNPQTPQTQPWHHSLACIVAETAKRGCWAGLLVGGCCKTGPDDIRKLRATLAGMVEEDEEGCGFYLENG